MRWDPWRPLGSGSYVPHSYLPLARQREALRSGRPYDGRLAFAQPAERRVDGLAYPVAQERTPSEGERPETESDLGNPIGAGAIEQSTQRLRRMLRRLRLQTRSLSHQRVADRACLRRDGGVAGRIEQPVQAEAVV